MQYILHTFMQGYNLDTQCSIKVSFFFQWKIQACSKLRFEKNNIIKENMDSTYYTQEIIINRFAPIFPKNFHYHFKFDFFFCLKFPFSSFCLQDEPIKLGPDQYGCPFCQFTTKRKDVMEKHICTHTGKKPFKCSFCSYSAVQNSDLKNHFKRRHAEYYVQDQ